MALFSQPTARALAPEFKRIEQNNERELMELEKEFYEKEKDYRARIEQRLEVAIEEETKSLREEHHRQSRESHRTILREMEEAEQEHRRLMAALREDLERDLYNHRLANKEKNEMERTSVHSESRRGHEASQKRIRSMQTTHEQEMISLRKDHEDQVKSLRHTMDTSRLELETQLRHEFVPDVELDDERVRKEAEAERDERIQKTIRKLQTDAIRFERGLKTDFDEEISHIKDVAEMEYDTLSRQQAALHNRISDLSSVRDEYGGQLRTLQTQLSMGKPLREYEEDLQVYEKGIATHRQRIRDMEITHRASVHDNGRAIREAVEDYKQKVEDTTLSMQDSEDDGKREMARLQEQHDIDLENLERRVKMDVGARDEEINVLRDAVHTEKIRAKKLRKLLQQYGKDDETR